MKKAESEIIKMNKTPKQIVRDFVYDNKFELTEQDFDAIMKDTSTEYLCEIDTSIKESALKENHNLIDVTTHNIGLVYVDKHNEEYWLIEKIDMLANMLFFKYKDIDETLDGSICFDKIAKFINIKIYMPAIEYSDDELNAADYDIEID